MCLSSCVDDGEMTSSRRFTTGVTSRRMQLRECGAKSASRQMAVPCSMRRFEIIDITTPRNPGIRRITFMERAIGYRVDSLARHMETDNMPDHIVFCSSDSFSICLLHPTPTCSSLFDSAPADLFPPVPYLNQPLPSTEPSLAPRTIAL